MEEDKKKEKDYIKEGQIASGILTGAGGGLLAVEKITQNQLKKNPKGKWIKAVERRIAGTGENNVKKFIKETKKGRTIGLLTGIGGGATLTAYKHYKNKKKKANEDDNTEK